MGEAGNWIIPNLENCASNMGLLVGLKTNKFLKIMGEVYLPKVIVEFETCITVDGCLSMVTGNIGLIPELVGMEFSPW